ncbi:hypothetical protein V6W11_13360 [Micromonospora profundi]|uniref:hypothetical protein n=1 Tax=Micromonospora profundi TaxID=1420889 RepID=UPI002FF01C6C
MSALTRAVRRWTWPVHLADIVVAARHGTAEAFVTRSQKVSAQGQVVVPRTADGR